MPDRSNDGESEAPLEEWSLEGTELGIPLSKLEGETDTSGVAATVGSKDSAWVVANAEGELLAETVGLTLFESDGVVLGSTLCRLNPIVGSIDRAEDNPEVGEPLATDTSGVAATVGSKDSAWVVANAEGELLAETVGPTLFEADGVVLGSTLC